MSTAPSAEGTRLRWYQGLDRYCWVVLTIAALGWLFDTMDQNLFNLVRRPSLTDLLRPDVRSDVRPGDFKDASKLALRLRDPKDPASEHLRTQITPETRALIDQTAPGSVPAGLPDALARDLTAVVQGGQLYEPARFTGVKLSQETEGLVKGQSEVPRARQRLNRLLLEDAYPEGLNRVLDGEVNHKTGLVTSIFLIGWAIGGFVFGILGDRIGRTGTMVLTILIYAAFTGLSGLTWNWESYAFTRFMTALGVGGEWAAGAALVAEVFPDRSRPMALGLLQALSAVGNMMAAGITLALGSLEAQWRVAYFIGALPALLVLWIRRSVKEPEQWRQAKAQAHTASELGDIRQLFINPVWRRHTIVATLMAAAGVGALWGVGFFSPDLLGRELATIVPDNTKRGQMISIVFLLQQLGAFFGIYLFAVYAEKVNRRSAFFLWFALAWISIVGFFWAVEGAGQQAFTRALILAPVLGFCTLGPFSGYSVYFPELFPTRLRATGCGFCYNAARILAAAAPFALGSLATSLGSFAQAASIVTCIYILGFIGTALGPETKGRPLPD